MNLLRVLILLALSFRGCCVVVAGDLPANDAGKNQLIVVGRPDVQPATWFDSIAELNQVKKAVAFTLLAPESKLFKERYQSVLGSEFPIVAYLKPSGAVVYFADRHSLPSNGTALLNEMKAAALAVRNAKPSTVLPQEFEINQLADCPDGNCYPEEQSQPQPLFPRLRKNPLDSQPERDWFSGFGTPLRDTANAIILLGFGLIAFCVAFAFCVFVIWNSRK